MNKEDLKLLKEKLSKLNEKEIKQRDLYLRSLAKGDIQGPSTEYASINKPWLKYYSEENINIDIPKMTCYDYLYKCNSEYLNRVALNYFGRKITFDELFNNIELTPAKPLEMCDYQLLCMERGLQ